MTNQRVCIIGAGPGGLVSAKVLLQTGKFDITIIEKASRIGGIWALDKQSTDGILSPYTPTNLSKFQVAFSDHAWQSVDTGNAMQDVSMFPKAWQVNAYLESYRQKYIPEDTIQLNTTVIAAKKTTNWLITTIHEGKKHVQSFDYLVMASGFFSAARPLERVIRSLPDVLPVAVIHSGRFRKLTDLFPEDSAKHKHILVIGGSNSAGEVAAAVAAQLSDTQYSPDDSRRGAYEDCRIIHVTPRPLYAVPPYLPLDDNSKTFVPLDFGFYNLEKRPEGPIVAGAGIAPKFVIDMIHDSIQKGLGGNQSDLGASALVPRSAEHEDRGTVQCALTESYSEYVRSGMISVVRGKVTAIMSGDGSVSAEVMDGVSTENIDNIGAVIYATGYTPIPALDILDADTKTALQYDVESMRLPLILEAWQTYTPAVRNLAFHGFYEGPYWGIMEMQARLTAHRWLGKDAIDRRSYESPHDLLELRKAMQARRLNVPQYWLGDYTGYMEEIASVLKLQRIDGPFGEREGTVCPARYIQAGDDQAEAEKTMLDLYRTWNECKQGKYVARAVFRALQGNWHITRRIDSRRTTFPSGILTGTASFHPRAPTSLSFDFEYLYVEQGVFKTSTGVEMTANRRYVYRYCEAQDQLSIWFIKPDRIFEVDYLFHNLTFSPPNAQKACTATADHLCIRDMYKTEYELPLKGIALPTFSIEHLVKGPEKDYTSLTTYKRRVS